MTNLLGNSLENKFGVDVNADREERADTAHHSGADLVNLGYGDAKKRKCSTLSATKCHDSVYVGTGTATDGERAALDYEPRVSCFGGKGAARRSRGEGTSKIVVRPISGRERRCPKRRGGQGADSRDLREGLDCRRFSFLTCLALFGFICCSGWRSGKYR